MEEILRAIYRDEEKSNPFLLYELVGKIRPVKKNDLSYATKKVRELTDLIKHHPDYRQALGSYLKKLFIKYDTVHLFVETGIMSLKGFSFELYNKIKHHILPTVENENDIRRLLNEVFYKKSDYKWIEAIPENLWEELIGQLGLLQHFKKQDKEDKNFNRLISSIQILSHRISALGTESEITNKMPQLDEINSPFLQQNKEVTLYIDRFNKSTDINNEDYKHIQVILNQSEESIQFLRKNKHKFGTSLRLTFLVRRLNQQIKRLRTLLLLIHQNDSRSFCQTTVCFFKILVKSENRKNSIRKHLKDNVDLLAFQVVEHAARTGISYIATGRKEFNKFLVKSLKGGVIVAFFAMSKIILNQIDSSPFGYAFIQSINYSLAFFLIYLTRSMLATTQPAMTASTIAGSLEKKQDESYTTALKRLAFVIIRTNRSQFISFIGNLLAALPSAILFSWIFLIVFGEKLVGDFLAKQIFADLNPVHSGSLIFAALAGFALFIAGLASGYYDNRVRYGEIPRRIARSRYLRIILGQERLDKLSTYLGMNLGNISGYLVLGLLFGSINSIGYIFGIPLEFRHITFSAANVGMALFGFDFAVSFNMLLPVIISLMGIGFLNFFVSFVLALVVAIKSRAITFRQSRKLFNILSGIIRKYPLDLFIAPGSERPEEAEVRKNNK